MNDSELPALQPGTLYLVATPIGNLEDITLRALRTLKQCDCLAAEDTRRARTLLTRYEIAKPVVSCHRFNEARRSGKMIERLQTGETVALISDAGSPGISDPGERLVRAVVAAGLRVEAVPGPCALVAAVTASGLPTDELHFKGFLPHKSGQRIRTLERLRSYAGTLVLYESPHRVEKLIGELARTHAERPIVIARELTKRFEEYMRGTPNELSELVKNRRIRGEFVVMVGPENVRQTESSDPIKPHCYE